MSVDAGGVQAASGKAEEESDTVVVSATTTTQPVVVWASIRAARCPSDTPYGNVRTPPGAWSGSHGGSYASR
jgi:hypothetical protein